LGAEIGVTACIIVCSFRVDSAVEFNRQCSFEAEEVDDERAYWDLAAPFPAFEPAAAQRLPQARFAGRLVTPQPAGAVAAQL
jgi:hypothetical protein